MEPPPRRYPGMTTRQAKAAYRKRGGYHITEIEQRQILRGAELAERAAKIKEKERQKKINKKKKEEKEAKEKERKKTCEKEGRLANPVRWKSSQRGIGDFLGKVNADTRTGENLIDSRKGGVQQDIVVFEDQNKQDDEASAAKEESQTMASRVRKRELRSLSDRKPLQDLSFNSVRPPLQTLQAETRSYNCPKVWDDDWAALVPSDTQVARELNSAEMDDTRRHELSRRQQSCTKHNTSQIMPGNLPCSATQTSALSPPSSDQRIQFISTQDLQSLEEDLGEGLEEMKTPRLKRKATAPPATSLSDRPNSKDMQRAKKRLKSRLAPEPTRPSVSVTEQLPRQPPQQPPKSTRVLNDSTLLQLKEIPVPAATQYGLISTQDLLELDLGLTELSSLRPRPPETSQTSFSFWEEGITDEDLLGLDIPGLPSNGSFHQRSED